MGAHPVQTPPCKTCGGAIPTFILVGGHRRYHRGRKQCFECNPFRTWSHRAVEGQEQRLAPVRKCRKCKGEFAASEFPTNSTQRGYKNSYCKTCHVEIIRTSRQRFKDQCIDYKGGRCERCGYDRCRDAFDFHHVDSLTKEFELSRHKRSQIDERVKAELDKCMLPCANRHREAHASPGAFRQPGSLTTQTS